MPANASRCLPTDAVECSPQIQFTFQYQPLIFVIVCGRFTLPDQKFCFNIQRLDALVGIRCRLLFGRLLFERFATGFGRFVYRTTGQLLVELEVSKLLTNQSMRL